MKQTSRLAVAFAFVVFSGGLLAGCGGKSESDATPATTTATTTPASGAPAGSSATPANNSRSRIQREVQNAQDAEK